MAKYKKNLNVYNFLSYEKDKVLKKQIIDLIKKHSNKCNEYKNIIKNLSHFNNNSKFENLPFIPVRLFKKYDLLSIQKKNIYKILTSSGTSGNVSKIYLDQQNAKKQIEVLHNIGSNHLGKQRMPMLVIDSNKIYKDKLDYSARKAAILGFSIFSSKTHFLLDDKLNLNIDLLIELLKKYRNQKILLFGFTFLVWDKLINYLKLKKIKLNNFHKNMILLHGGGWKKLEDLSVDNTFFKKEIKKLTGIDKIINYYGMIEQTGSIFFECEYGYYHTSIYSDIIIRNNKLQNLKYKNKGIIQLLSNVPTSYPGNNILTEDLGEIFGVDNCKCKRAGKYFKVYGRIPSAELRGCSNADL